MIRVIYKDGREDLVTQKFLDILLHMNEVQMFQRENDWVIVGVDPLRNSKQQSYPGEERRIHQQTSLQPLQFCC